jgi:hypothetical protein
MITVPKEVYEDKYIAYPKGTYKCSLGGVGERTFGDQGAPDWGFILQPTFTDMAANDAETADPKGRPFRGDINVVVQGTSLIDLEANGVADWSNLDRRLRGGFKLLSQLAVAVGVVAPNDKGQVAFELKPFVDQLRKGQFDGKPLIIQIGHYNTRNGETRDELRRVAPGA